jgi:hypothetical protein
MHAAAACNLRAAPDLALGRIVCILCCISSLPLIHPPSILAAAAAAIVMLRCCIVFVPRHLRNSPDSSFNSRGQPFDFVWKGRLNAFGIAEEGDRRVGQGGFSDMMRTLHEIQMVREASGADLNSAILDVQVIEMHSEFLASPLTTAVPTGAAGFF